MTKLALAVVAAAALLSAPRPAAAQQQRRTPPPPPRATRTRATTTTARPASAPTGRTTSRALPTERAAAGPAATEATPASVVVRAIVFPAVPPIPALSGELTGIVSDSSGAAIPSAEVLVVALGVVVYSDENGAFRLPKLPPGNHEVRVRRIGFHPRTRVLSTQAGESWQMLVALDAAPAVLTPVGVTANVGLGKMAAFERRRHGNVGVFITRDQIASRKAMLLSDIMRTMPGVTLARTRTEDNKLQMRPAPLGGRFDCSPDFYVDGLFVPGLNIDAIPPADVQGIELYRGPSDTPADFRSMNAPCGVVAIWTRDPQDKRQLP